MGEFEKGIIHKTGGKSVIEAAKDWVREHILEPVKTKIGDVIFNAEGIKNSLSHGFASSKIDAIPAIEPTLRNGVYLDSSKDKDGKPIDNHFFAARANFGGEDRVVFVRTREAAGDNNRFYVHEVYTEDEIMKAVNARGVADPDRPFQGAADFYKNLIARYLEVKEQPARAQG